VAVVLCWRHPDRREVEIALYVSLRMMHLGGRGRTVVLCPARGGATLALELDESASEEDAQAWASLFHRRYRIETTIEELLAGVTRYGAVYMDGGIGEFLNAYEQEQRRMEELRRKDRRERR